MKKLAVIIILFSLPIMYFKVKHFIDIDTCLDNSICSENLKINTRYGFIAINKENCLKYHWLWNEKNKTCKLD